MNSNIEVRAGYKSQKHAQDAYDAVLDEINATEKKIKQCDKQINIKNNEIENLYKDKEDYYKYRNKLVGHLHKIAWAAIDQNFELKETYVTEWNFKRSEENDFESRKSEILSDLEERSELSELKEKLNKAYAKLDEAHADKDKANIKKYQNEVDELEDEIANFDKQEKIKLKKQKELVEYYQKQFDRLYKGKYQDKLLEYEEKVKELGKDNKETKATKKELDDIIADLKKIYTEAYKNNKVKIDTHKVAFRNEESDFETRKNEVLDNLELRKLETQEDYQKEYDNLSDECEKLVLLANDYSDRKTNGLNKLEQELIDKWESTVNKIRTKEKNCWNKLSKLRIQGDKLVSEAKKKGFKIKTNDWLTV